MPRVKKSKARKVRPRLDKSININIKNVMKQLQNEPPRDYIRFVKDPKRDLNFGSTTRAFNPSVTYASTPLSAFPSLASVQNAPSAPQLSSRPAVYRPDILGVETNQYDIEPSGLSKRAIPSSPIPAPTPGEISAGASSRADFASPINMQPRPIGNLLSEFTPIPQQDESELLVSDALPSTENRYFAGSLEPDRRGTAFKTGNLPAPYFLARGGPVRRMG